MNRISFGVRAGASIFAALLLTSLASAQNSDMVRVRGTIQNVDGQTLDVKGRDGTPLKVKLADDVKVLALDRKSMDDVKHDQRQYRNRGGQQRRQRTGSEI
jgi:hypothetical protein